MTYLDNLLATGESVRLRAHRHILYLLQRIALYVLGVIALWVLAYAAQRWIPDVGNLVMLGVLMFSIVPLVIAVYRFLTWRLEEFAVTNYRIVQVDGILNKRTFDSSLDKVNDVTLRQSIFGRMFGFGDIEIITGSEIGVNSILGIADPMAFKRALLEAKVEANRSNWPDRQEYQRGEQPGAVHTSDSARIGRSLQLLDSLKDLRDSGLITDEEYEIRRRQALER